MRYTREISLPKIRFVLAKPGNPSFRSSTPTSQDLSREFILIPAHSNDVLRDSRSREGESANPEATRMIFIFSTESTPRGRGTGETAGEGRRQKRVAKSGTGRGRTWQRLAAAAAAAGGGGGGGWQSVEGSGADQWHDGGNPGF